MKNAFYILCAVVVIVAICAQIINFQNYSRMMRHHREEYLRKSNLRHEIRKIESQARWDTLQADLKKIKSQY